MYMLKKYLIFSFLFTIIDSIYLSLASSHFNSLVTKIQGSSLKLQPVPTILCYLFLTLGLFYFGILKKFTIKECFLLGIFVYGVYETTNKAIFKKWDWFTLFLDTLWGGILFSLSVFLFRLF